VAAAWPGPARGDGDPASDVLATQSLFLPQDAGISAGRQRELVALLDAARRAGLRLRVAVIASPADLGSVTELWRRPSEYARFLGQELSLVFRGPLLVAMPNGFALYDGASRAPAAPSAVAALRAPGSVAGLGEATLTATQRLAAVSGHPIALPSGVGGGAGAPSSSDPGAWIVFGAGALLIALAWTLSLRSRPLELPARRPAGRD